MSVPPITDLNLSLQTEALKMRRSWTFLLLSLLLACPALADEKNVQKYRNFTPEQVKDLPEKVLNNELPLMFKFAAQQGLSNDADLLFAMWLNRLMYPGVTNLRGAVKAFQSDLGDNPTGILTVWQIYNLEQRAEMQNLSPIIFPDQFFSSIHPDSASISGTLTILDEKIAWPINHVKLRCWKEENYCELDQFQIAVPDRNSWSQRYQVMANSTEFYTITRWENDNIDAVPMEKETGCRTSSLTLNFKTKEFFSVTRNGGGECKILGSSFPKLAKPRIAQIVDGAEIINAEFNRLQKAAFEVLASDFRKKVGTLPTVDPKKK